MFGLETSEATLTSVTDRVIEDVQEYVRICLSCRLDGHSAFQSQRRRPDCEQGVYCVIGMNRDGLKDILGMYLGHSEDASFWLVVLSDLRSRGIEDIFIACIDNLKGFAEAIEASFPIQMFNFV